MTEVVRGPVFLCSVLLTYVILGGGAACFSAVGQVLWPQRLSQVRDALIAAPLRCAGIGTLNALGLVLIMAVLSHGGGGARLLVLVLLVTALVLLGMGLPALVSHLGAELARSASPLAQHLTGGFVLTACLLLPFVGWALVAGCLLAALGGSITAVTASRPRQPDPGSGVEV